MAETKKKMGRPVGKVSQAKLDLRQAALPYAKLALKTLAEVCRTGTDSARVAAANALLDRGYGKPVQSHRVHGLLNDPLRVIPDMTDAEAAAAYQSTLNNTEEEVASTVH